MECLCGFVYLFLSNTACLGSAWGKEDLLCLVCCLGHFTQHDMKKQQHINCIIVLLLL